MSLSGHVTVRPCHCPAASLSGPPAGIAARDERQVHDSGRRIVIRPLSWPETPVRNRSFLSTGMCRFLAYLGPPIVVDELLIKPENSLIRQSRSAHEMASPINGDGFGLGWYRREVRPEPGLFRSVTPAWSNQNLLYNASLLQSDCIFAHVRAASEGTASEANCHPFHYRHYLMMHNGGVPGFQSLKRALVDRLDEDLFLWIHGQTDTEHLFALLMQTIRHHPKTERRETLDMRDLADCFQAVFDQVETMMGERGITEPASFNMLATDGQRMVGTRYSTDPARATPTLYYATGERFVCVDGHCSMVDSRAGGQRAVLVASESLTRDEAAWNPIPANHCLAVDESHRLVLIPMKGAMESTRWA